VYTLLKADTSIIIAVQLVFLWIDIKAPFSWYDFFLPYFIAKSLDYYLFAFPVIAASISWGDVIHSRGFVSIQLADKHFADLLI